MGGGWVGVGVVGVGVVGVGVVGVGVVGVGVVGVGVVDPFPPLLVGGLWWLPPCGEWCVERLTGCVFARLCTGV